MSRSCPTNAGKGEFRRRRNSEEPEGFPASLRARLAARAAEQNPHQRSGHADEVQWLASTTGVSKKAAKQQLDTVTRLDELPTVRDAVEQGQLSQTQADLVARAAEADPSQPRRLVRTAEREDLKGLEAECDRVIAGADDDEAATHARVHAARSARFWSDADGTHHVHAQGIADDPATLRSRITAQRDLIFRDASRSRRRESTEVYDFDALIQLVTRKTDDTESDDVRVPKRDLLIHIDWSAARRGDTLAGECREDRPGPSGFLGVSARPKLPLGVGPVPVEVALDFDADPFIKAVIRDGTDIRTAVHYGRPVPAELRTALEARDRVCSNDGYIEIDHAIVDHAKGGPPPSGTPSGWEPFGFLGVSAAPKHPRVQPPPAQDRRHARGCASATHPTVRVAARSAGSPATGMTVRARWR